MPTYEFKCSENPEHKHKEIRGMTEPQIATICVEEGCEGRLIRVFGAPPITFKGTGFSAKRG